MSDSPSKMEVILDLEVGSLNQLLLISCVPFEAKSEPGSQWTQSGGAKSEEVSGFVDVILRFVDADMLDLQALLSIVEVLGFYFCRQSELFILQGCMEIVDAFLDLNRCLVLILVDDYFLLLL